MSARVTSWALGWVLLAPACSGDSTGDTGASGGTGTTGMDTDTDGPPGPPVVANACGNAPAGGIGRWSGTLRQASSNLGGACGQGGPDAFLRLTTPARVDVRVQAEGVAFVPRVGVMLAECEERWDDRGVLCTEAIEGWVQDLPPGTELTIAVGIDPEDPALQLPATDPPDPLDFILDVAMREVLEAGVPCGLTVATRCAPGTACLPDGPDGPTLCTALAADTCANPEEAALELGGGVIAVDPGAEQTDAHAHGCTGSRWRERVLALKLPDGLAPGTGLEIRVEHSQVGLALRAPGCDPGAEVACADAAPGGAQVTLPDAEVVGAAGIAPILFVELPDSLGQGDAVISLNYDFVAP